MKKMNIEKAIEILELHNKWRRDNDGKYKMAEPKELGMAIDAVVSEFTNLHLQNVSGLLDWGSKGLIGNSKERFKQLKRKGWDWRSFYNGWLEGRVDMLAEFKGWKSNNR